MKSKIIIFILAIIVCNGFVSAFLISDQGANVRQTATGNLTVLANLTISIYNEATGGDLIFQQNFADAIVNGSWNVMINPNLEYGRAYYKDYQVNGEDLDFDGNERLQFQSSVGKMNNASFINFSLINSCSAGSSIRLIHENGSVECETDDSSGTASLTNYALKNQSETFTGNITTSQTGFFGLLGSLASRISKIFVQDIDFSGIINGSGNIITVGNVTANYFCNSSGNCWNTAGGTAAGSDSWAGNHTSYYNKTQLYNKSEIDAFNATWSSTYNASYASSVANNSFNQSLTDTVYAGILWAYNQTSPAITDINSRFWNRTQSYNRTEVDNNLSARYLATNPLNFLNGTTISNTTIARTGNCPAGQVVQNTTNDGVQCITPPAGSEVDPIWSGNLTNGVSADLDPLTNIVQSLGDSTKRWLRGWFQDLDVSRNVTVAGNVSAGYYFGSLNQSTFPTSACSGTDKVIQIYANGTVRCATDQTGGTSQTVLILGSNVATGADTNLVDLTGMNFTAAANTTYKVEIIAIVQAAAATTGHGFGVNCAQTPQIVSLRGTNQLANTGTQSGWQAIANNAIVGVSSGIPSASTNTAVHGGGIIRAHASNTGSCTFRFRSETTAVTTAMAGTTIIITQL